MIKLNVLGISYSQTQSGAYALILTEENGERRIPIIVGGFEAQSIAIELEGLKPPRPLTHDLFVSFSKTYGISIREILIYKLEEGVFFSQLLCDDGNQKISLDARTSDAIALALRFKCPIYTTEEIINKAGIVLDFDKEGDKEERGEPKDFKNETSYDTMDEETDSIEYRSLNMDELKDLLSEAVANEDYEKASLIKNVIDKRTNK